MSERIEQLIRDYPKMKTEQRCLFHQISDFRGITEQEMIDTMYFSQPEGERVQTSGTANKTASIALNYRERMERINQEWYEHLEKQLVELTDELNFFEGALRALPVNISQVMWDLVVEGMTWDEILHSTCPEGF